MIVGEDDFNKQKILPDMETSALLEIIARDEDSKHQFKAYDKIEFVEDRDSNFFKVIINKK